MGDGEGVTLLYDSWGLPEAVTRARVRVTIIRCWDSEEGRRVYELYREGYQAVVREGGLKEQRLYIVIIFYTFYPQLVLIHIFSDNNN